MCGAEKIEVKKCVFWNNALSLGGRFWCARGGQFGDLYYATLVSFAEGFAPPGF